jgi:hypothetical protein
VTEFDGMRDMAFSMSCLGVSDKLELETGIEKDIRMSKKFTQLPNEIKEHYKTVK